ncbi:MAG: hypothetical protein E7360_02180 [Clostridiales bacterium]|nr:hypothetical protein [Clostridiales bacterium]
MKSDKKYGVIDVGSNSVRAILYSDGKILYKRLITSRLGEGLYLTGNITESAFERTLNAVKTFVYNLVALGADEIYPFATEAVRSAKNGKEFTEAVTTATGLTVDVVSGEEEGELGLLGALKTPNGGIIDIGGASAEIVATKDKKIIYSHSLPLGAVRLHDRCGEDENLLKTAVDERIEEYGKVPVDIDYYAIGGTATTVGMIDARLLVYDENVVDGRRIEYSKIVEIYNTVKNLTVSERIEKLHINEKRAEIIVGGIYLLKRIMEQFKIEKITVSEGDNMLGYVKKKILGESYER